MKKQILLLLNLKDEDIKPLTNQYQIIRAVTPEERSRVLENKDLHIEGILTNGTTGASVKMIDKLPHLKIISCLGAGHENIAKDAARARGIELTNGAGANTICVAEHAMALTLAIIRDIPRFNDEVKSGHWTIFRDVRPQVDNRRLGIFGLGTIGIEIAKRAEAFGMKINYHNRSKRSDVSYNYFDSLLELAKNSDVLIVVVPGGAETYHKINSEVLEALGPEGFLINVARGTLVDSEALCDALENNKLAGAALDVVEGEPKVPERLRNQPRVIFTPHMGGRSHEAMIAMVDLATENFNLHFDNKKVKTPVIV